MAKYKVWLTVKDCFGNTKEVDGGTIDVDLAAFSEQEIAQIEEQLPFEDYIKRDDLDTELEDYATDTEVTHEVIKVVSTNEALKYSTFDFKDD